MAKRGSKSARSNTREPAIRNRRARHDFFISDTLTCGLKLTGTEIKSIRSGQASLQEGYVRAQADPPQLTLHGVHIAEYPGAGPKHQHEPTRTRVLLAHKREIRKWAVAANARGATIVPLEIVWQDARAKLVIGLGVGKKKHDKRESMKKKAHQRDIERER
ncbi:MAG: SsrA-binding protein SmpB [Phycisphaerales bacterium]|nr:SsrA-binding protein SmpB [Phycisphaerales bacterium]